MASPGPRRIVLVDDEEVLAWSLSNRLARVRPSLTIDTANNGEDALARLRAQPADLLVADIRMPGMSGIDLILAARGESPQLPVIVMTAFRTPEIQRIAEAPYTGFLEKPFEFDKLVELVDEALARAPKQTGFSGAISMQTLPDVVQLYVLSSATGMLVVAHQSGEGRIYFEQGGILHAACGELRGDAAFYEIMMWSGGEFRMRVGVRAPERSIESDWQSLLMESCRRVDEQRRADKPPSRRGWTEVPPPCDSDPEIEISVEAMFSDIEGDLPEDDRPDAAADFGEVSPPISTHDNREEVKMNIKDSLAKLTSIDGFVGAALVDSESGMLLGQEGGGPLNLEVAAAGNTEVVRAKRKTMQSLALKEQIEDILISLNKQYHIIRPLRARSTLFFYVALDRSKANLAMARIALADVEKDLQV